MDITIRKPSDSERSQALSWPTWTCGPSSFEWGYDDQETCLILEGQVMVEALGKEYNFGPGDWVVFPKGLACRWNVKSAIKKHYRFG